MEGVGARARVSSEELTEVGSRSPAFSLPTQPPVFYEHEPGLLPPPHLLWLLFCTFPLETHQLPPSPHSCFFSNVTCPDHQIRAVPSSSLYFPASCLSFSLLHLSSPTTILCGELFACLLSYFADIEFKA